MLTLALYAGAGRLRPVELDHPRAPCPSFRPVQPIYVLRDDRHPLAQPGLQLRQRPVTCERMGEFRKRQSQRDANEDAPFPLALSPGFPLFAFPSFKFFRGFGSEC